jgi:hypothetical protein
MYGVCRVAWLLCSESGGGEIAESRIRSTARDLLGVYKDEIEVREPEVSQSPEKFVQLLVLLAGHVATRCASRMSSSRVNVDRNHVIGIALSCSALALLNSFSSPTPQTTPNTSPPTVS